MKLDREQLAHSYRRARHLGQQAWNTGRGIMATTDKFTYFDAKGFLAISDRLDPDTRQTISKGLLKYGEHKQRIDNVADNFEKLNSSLKGVGWEL